MKILALQSREASSFRRCRILCPVVLRQAKYAGATPLQGLPLKEGWRHPKRSNRQPVIPYIYLAAKCCLHPTDRRNISCPSRRFPNSKFRSSVFQHLYHLLTLRKQINRCIAYRAHVTVVIRQRDRESLRLPTPRALLCGRSLRDRLLKKVSPYRPSFWLRA